jgi:hypothetical protein
MFYVFYGMEVLIHSMDIISLFEEIDEIPASAAPSIQYPFCVINSSF